MLGDELHGHPEHPVRAETAVFLENEGRLQVVVERDHPRSVSSKVVGRCLPLEVDQDALDHVARLDGPHRVNRLLDHVFVDPPSLEDAHHHVFTHPAGEEIGVERVNVRVGLGVVAEERLAAGGRGLAALGHCGARAEQRRELVAELVANRAEPKAEQVLQVRLEGEAIPDDPVEAELVLEAVRICSGQPLKMCTRMPARPISRIRVDAPGFVRF